MPRLANFLSQRIDQTHAQVPTTNLQQIPTKLMVVIYDPILENYGGVKLHEYFPGWQNPDTLTGQLISDLNTVSHGLVNYQVVERIERDEWLPHTNGQRYTDEIYVNGWSSGTLPDYGDGDYNAIINENGIEQKVKEGKVDEVWLWAYPEVDPPPLTPVYWCESIMAGNGAYLINCPRVVSGVDSKAFVMMGFNYERGMPEALESYGHRTESIIKRVYGSWEALETHDWNKFTLLDRDLSGRSGVGNAHNAFNAEVSIDPTRDYHRTSTRIVATSADDWYNFPQMIDVRTDKNCTDWGCTDYGYLKWWYDHMPHVSGFKEGRLNNWWRYIVDVDQFKDKTFLVQEVDESDLTELNTEINVNNWACNATGATCDLENETVNKKRGYAAMKFTTEGTQDTNILYPIIGNANWNLSDKKFISFWAYATTSSQNGFQNSSPIVILRNDNGSEYQYWPNSNVMNQAINQWYRFTIPLTGDAIWSRISYGSPTLTDIDQVEIHNTTLDTGFTIIFDEVGFVGDLTEMNANQWNCWAEEADCQLYDNTAVIKRGQSALEFDTTAPFDSQVAYPATGSANWDLRSYNYLNFWAYAINNNPAGFQNNSPWILLKNDDGSYFKYITFSEPMNEAIGVWKQFQIPLSGDGSWVRTPSGNPTLADIDKIEIHNDTWGSGLTILFDEVGFVKVGKPPTVNISSPTQNTIVNGKIPVAVTASDDTAILRTDLYVDGFFDDSIFDPSDALSPYVFEWDTSAVSDGVHTLISRTYDSVGNETMSAPITVFKNPPTQTLIFSPPHDTYVKSDVPNNKFGTATTLRVRKASSVTLNSYLKFNVSGVSGTVQSAKVRLYVSDTSPSGGSIYTMSNNYVGTATPWIETGLTWNNAPTISGTPLSSVGNAPLNTWVEFEVTPAITGNGTYSLAISSTNSNAVYYRSDEATSNRPQLVVVATSIVTPSPSPSPSSSPNPSPTPSLVPTPTPSPTPTPTPSGSPVPSSTDIIFSDGFESGNTSAWSAEIDGEADLNVTPGAALVGAQGLAALIDNTTSMFVRDDRPTAEQRYRARFYFDPNTVSMASSDVHTIFVGRTNSSAVFNVQLNNNTGTSSGYRIRVQIFNDVGGNTNGTYFTLADSSHAIEVDWQAATGVGANNGSITLWIDGVSKETISAVDNDTLRVEETRMGPLTGIDVGTSGTVYFDSFESRRSSYIGP